MGKNLKIILINPVTKRYFWNKFYLPSLGLPLLAALTPSDIDISIIDEAESPLEDFPEADLVGISVLTAAANRAYEIADIYRARGTKVVLGGIHVSSLPEEAIQHADAVVIGEGDAQWPKVIDDFKKDQLQRFYRSETPPELENLPRPRWDLIESLVGGNKEIVYSVQAGRGCPSQCNFCNVPEIFGRRFRMRSVSRVIADIEAMERTRILILDDNLIANLKFAKELLQAMIPLKKEWMGLASLANLHDENILKLMADAGCKHLFIGFETINPENISLIDKKINKVNEYNDVINKIHSYGIKIIGSFIVGMDYDDESVFDQIYEFIERNNIYMPIVNILTPYPGTRLFTEMKEQNRMLSYDWSKYSCDEVVFKPAKMTPDTLQTKHAELHGAILKLLRGRFIEQKKRSYSAYDF